MPGHIGVNKHLQRQARPVFHEICAPGHAPMRDDNGGVRFYPWKRQSPVRDAAPAPNTINTHVAGKYSLNDVVTTALAIGERISALEQKRAAQRQLAEQQQLALQQRSAQTQFEQPTRQPTQDRAAPCSCHALKIPVADSAGVKTMLRNPALAPLRRVTFDPVSRSRATRDQGNSLENNYLEKPSRFSSQEADRMANYLPPGSAGRVSNKEAVNDISLRALRDAQMQHNISGQPQPAMTQGSDLSSAFASELQAIPSGQPNAAMNVLNKHYNAAKDGATRDAIERVWRDFMSSYDARGDSPWRPMQPEVRDAPWSNLYEQNKGTIGGDPNKIQVGQSLNLPGGGTHTVQSGETLSGIASGNVGGMHPLASEGGGASASGAGPAGSYSSGGDLTSGEGAPAGAPGAHNAANVPTPPMKPSDLSESSSSSSSSGETPTPTPKPAEYGGTGESPSGTITPEVSESGGGSSSGSEGTGLAKFVRGLVGEE
jgi:LysM repeat protein/predicted RNA-binding Zn ribbon-like protein